MSIMNQPSCITILSRRLPVLVLVMLLFCGPHLPTAAQEQKVRLVITVTGIRNDKGHIAASLFNGEKGFPNDDSRAVGRKLNAIKDRAATIVFDEVPPGTYGVALLHDEDKNNKLDTNLFGFPREGYGVSNNPRPARRSPRFSDARFVAAQAGKEQNIEVKIVYLRLGDVLR
jgi:uncharacterized protein (DUF2141 family)